MGVEGCTKCIKYLLFVFNFIFWLAGGIILGVALWLRHDSQTTNILYLQLGDKQAPNTFYVGIYILIAVGAVMMFVGFLGCYGAIQESQCLLGTFFTCLVILFACEVAAGIWGFVNKDQIAKDVKQFYDQALQQALMGESDANNAKAVVKTFHETLDCCGSDIITSTFTPVWRDDLCRKDSLKSFFENTNCHKKIDELFSGKLYLIGIAAVVVAVIMVSVTAWWDREKPPRGNLVLFQLVWICPSPLDAPGTPHAALCSPWNSTCSLITKLWNMARPRASSSLWGVRMLGQALGKLSRAGAPASPAKKAEHH
uniref:CD81 molecule n=1 Tax=Serinus canaria TaxID=9135 RepID=A0A8C9MN45_SERCA